MKTIKVKLGKMKKPDDCVIYKPHTDGTIVFQGDRVIGAVKPDTRKGVINFHKNPNFVHLQCDGVQTWEYTPEFVAELVSNTPKSGDVIGTNPVCGTVLVA